MAKSRTIQLIIAGKDRVSKTLKRITGGLKKWGAGALKITGMLTAGFAAVGAGLTALYVKLAGAIDEQAKVASSLGIANEALGVFRDAAGYAGVSSESLSTSLKKMSQNIADAANGIGEGRDALEALGLSAEDLQRMGPEKAFAAIITKLDQIPNGIKKTGLAMDLFGRSGAAMANLTSKGLTQAQADADKLKLKLTSAQAANVEAANDAWARIKIVTSDFLKYVTARFAPSLKAGFDKAFEFLKNQDLKSWADNIVGGFKTAARAVINLFVPALSLALSAVEKVTMAFTGWKLLWAELQYQFGGFMQFVWTGLNKIREATNAMHDRAAAAGLASPDGNTEGKRIANEQKQILEMIAQKRKAALDVQSQELKKQGEQNQAFDDMRGKVETLDQKIKEFGATATATADDFVSGEKKKQAALDTTTAKINEQIAAMKPGRGSFSVAGLSEALEDEADKISHWLIEIEDGSQVWQELPDGSVRSCSAGTNSDSQVIPDVAITFAADIDLTAGLLDPELNRERARLRVTDEDYTRYFRIEKQPGRVEKTLNYPTLSGRAWAGIITEFRPLTYDFINDISASDMARLICTEHAASLSGDTVGVIWLATQDPTIPGGRWQVSRRSRLELLRELVTMCGAKLRVSLDGLNFEVYDHPSRALSETATRVFSDAQSLSYELIRVKQPGNAVRVQGEQANYTRPTLPVIAVSVSPTSIAADGITTATATARVYDSAGTLVQHQSIIDEAITAGSYTAIPVSGCFAVQAVWLNVGTAEVPVKGSRVTPSGFSADEITVPDNGTQLFIVSYTQAETVSWNLADQADEILGEAQTTSAALEVSTTNAIGRVIGVYLATDTNRAGTNYASGGSYTPNTTAITLGISPGSSGTAVIIDYETYNGTPLSATLGQSSSLCDASGAAVATIGSGTTVGTAKITASALGQEGNCWLSLLGSAIDSMTLESDKAQILVGSRIEGRTNVSDPNLTVHSDIYDDGLIGFDGYVVASNPVAGNVQISSALTIQYAGYRLVGAEHRIYMRVTGDFQFFDFGASAVDVSYDTTAEVDNEAGTATITATVLQGDLSPVSDGTQVDFTIRGPSGAELSSTRVYTTSGVVTTTLTAGGYTGRVYISAVCGSQRADVSIEIVSVITDDNEFGTVSYPTGTSTYPSSSDDADPPADSSNGSRVCGSRRLVGCEGEPLDSVWVTVGNISKQTDSDGWFTFCVDDAGSYEGTAEVGGETVTFTFTVSVPV